MRVKCCHVLYVLVILRCSYSEVFHPRCVFKLYGDVDSVQNTTTNIWQNDGVHQQYKNCMFRPIAAIFRFHSFLAKRVLYGVDKKNQLDVTFVSFISLLLVAQHVSGNHVPIIRS